MLDKRVKFAQDINKAFKNYFKESHSEDSLSAVLNTYDWNSWLLEGGCGLDIKGHLEQVERALYNR